MTSRRRWRRPLLTLAAAATFAVSSAAEVTADDEAIAVTNFSLKSLEGRSVSLHESLADGPVLVSFWATWCKPCLQELPKIAEMSGEWSERGLTVFAISIDKPRSHGRVRSYVRSKGLDLEVLLDPNQEAFRKLQGQSVPYLVLIDPSGKTRYAKVGYRPGDEKELASAVDALFARDSELAEPEPSSETVQ